MDILKLIINIIISLFFFINFILIEKHFINNLCSKKNNNKTVLIYWYDFTFILLIISIISFIKIFDNFEFEFMLVWKNQIFLYYPLLYSNQAILNIFFSIQLLFKINKIKNKSISNLSLNLNSKLYYFIKHAIIIIFEVFLIFFLKYKLSNNDNYLIFNCINIFQSIIIIISISISFIVSNKYKKFINFRKSLDNKNNIIIEEKKYENNRKRILVVIQHYFYKNICDFFLNFPNLIIITNTKFRQAFIDIFKKNINNNINTSNFYLDLYFYLNMFFGFLYLYIFCILLLNIDYFNNGSIEKILNVLFCVKSFHFYFGNGKKMRNSNNSYLKNIKIDKINYNSYFKDDSEYDNINNVNESFSDSTNDVITSSDDSSDEEKRVNKKVEIQYEYSPFNFFIIYKLLYIYFKFNKDIYLELEKNDDNINKIDNINSFIKSENNENNQISKSIHSNISDEEKKNRKIRYYSFYQKKNNGVKGRASNVNIRENNNIKEKIENIKLSLIILYSFLIFPILNNILNNYDLIGYLFSIYQITTTNLIQHII